jgi:UDP-3-O-[3-hydroxymyristoyl] glucosamine N-acyltransferase
MQDHFGGRCLLLQREDGFDQLLSGGRVVIKDNVGIGALCTIDKGLLVIPSLAKELDNQVHVGHDTVIGRNA